MTMGEHTIAVTGLSKQYQLGQRDGDTTIREAVRSLLRRPFARREVPVLWALKDVSFQVGAGEVVGIVGRNGAGKSTLLKLLSRITYPTQGDVRVVGRTASLLEVGTGFHDELTGRENIFLNGSIMGMKRREIAARLDRIVAFSGVETFLDTPIKRYSSGMRLRLGFAVAAHLDPDVFFVDEVLAVGDAQFQRKCLDTMSDLRAGGRTVLLVSHNMAAIENLCRRTLWIDGGRLRMDGPTGEVIRAYMSTFAEAQHGSASLEHLETRGGNGEARFTGVEFLDRAGQPVQYVACGDSVTIRLHYRAFTAIRNLTVGMEINTDMGMKLIGTNTLVTGCYTHLVSPGDGYVDLEIDFLNVMAGRYYLSLYLGPEGHNQDILQNAVIMDVEPSDFYRTGHGMDSRYGLMFLPCRWKSGGNVRPAPAGGLMAAAGSHV